MYLNTQVPPFDKIEVRQALAFAIDRREVQRRYPGGRSAITCQAIPPNFPGYLPYCPYTATPDLTGTWTAPDLREADKLVGEAGTAGMKVTILSWSEFASVSRYFASVLDDLGYKAHVEVFSDFRAFYRRFVDSKNRVQAGGFWASTDPVPSEIFQFITCKQFLRNNPLNDNASEFCNHQAVDAAYDHARALDQSDPTAAREAWSALDQKVTDLAPFIPAVIPEGVEFLSKRTGNYQHNPSLGILLSQLWVT